MTWQTDELHEILECETPEQVFAQLLREAQRMGMQDCAWGIKLPVSEQDAKYVMLNSYSPEWQEKYIKQNYVAIDPTVKHAFRSVLPVLWSDVANQVPSFWEDARSFGLNEGVAQSVWDHSGSLSLLSLSRGSTKFSTSELHDKIPKISWLSQVAHAAMTRLLIPKDAPSTASDLSKREKELLRLAAEGMTSAQIADRLYITCRTVDFHFDRARKKLQAGNRAQAIFQATQLGLI